MVPEVSARRSARRSARVVVLGAGFAGASLLRHLPPALRRPGETLLIDRREEYTFVPLIHEVAVGRVHPRTVSSPMAPICAGGCEFLHSEVSGIDLTQKTLETPEGPVGYEYLVLNPGSVAAEPGPLLQDHFHSFWSLDDALRLRGALGDAWRRATSPGPQPPQGILTVAIVGGGATGVEVAAEVATLFDYLGKRSHRRPSEKPRVVLLEARHRLMDWLDPYFDSVARKTLSGLGVEVRLNTPVEMANAEGVLAGGNWVTPGYTPIRASVPCPPPPPSPCSRGRGSHATSSAGCVGQRASAAGHLSASSTGATS